MTLTDSPRFARQFARLVELFGGVRMSEGRLEGYFEALKDLPIAALEDAMEAAARTLERFPRPADLRRLVRERRPRQGTRGLRLPPGFRHADPEHADTAFRLIRAICETRMPAAQRLAHFRAMAHAFPGVGWEDAAAHTAEIVAAQIGGVR